MSPNQLADTPGYEGTDLDVKTLGQFAVRVNGKELHHKDWKREKSIQLFQFLLTQKNKRGIHKEEIIDHLWEHSSNPESDFKVALHGLNKTLEPERKQREEPIYIVRDGSTYHLNWERLKLDVNEFDKLLKQAYLSIPDNNPLAIEYLEKALKLYNGSFLPNRIYEDWSSAERERLHLAALNAKIQLAELYLESNPNTSIILAQEVIITDESWEDAYRVLMLAYMNKGNRPQAINSYKQCLKALDQAYGITPLPETQELYLNIISQ